MLVAAVRIVMTLIIVALVPYTLTVVAVVVLWFDERLYEIARKNPTGRDPRSTYTNFLRVVERNAQVSFRQFSF